MATMLSGNLSHGCVGCCTSLVFRSIPCSCIHILSGLTAWLTRMYWLHCASVLLTRTSAMSVRKGCASCGRVLG